MFGSGPERDDHADYVVPPEDDTSVPISQDTWEWIGAILALIACGILLVAFVAVTS